MKLFIFTMIISTTILAALKLTLYPYASWFNVFTPALAMSLAFVGLLMLFFIYETFRHYWPEKVVPISRWLISFYRKKIQKVCKEGKGEFPIVCDACEHFMLYGAARKAACDLGHKTKYFMCSDCGKPSGYFRPESETCKDYE